jgi:hypothetical protein
MARTLTLFWCVAMAYYAFYCLHLGVRFWDAWGKSSVEHANALQVRRICSKEDTRRLLHESCGNAERVLTREPVLVGLQESLESLSVCGFENCGDIFKLVVNSFPVMLLACSLATFVFFHIYRTTKKDADYSPPPTLSVGQHAIDFGYHSINPRAMTDVPVPVMGGVVMRKPSFADND